MPAMADLFPDTLQASDDSAQDDALESSVSNAPQGNQPVQAAAAVAPTKPAGAPPTWDEVKSSPLFDKLLPDGKQLAFQKWVQQSDNFLTQSDTPRPALSAFDNYITKQGRDLGVNFVYGEDGRPRTYAQNSNVLGTDQTPAGVNPNLPALVPLDRDTSFLHELDNDSIGVGKELYQLFVKPPGEVASNVWNYIAGTAAGTSALDKGLAYADAKGKLFDASLQDENGKLPAGVRLDEAAANFGGIALTGVGGSAIGSLVRMGGLAATEAADETYHNAIQQGATPLQASASSGVAATVSAGTFALFGPLAKFSATAAMGENAANFAAGIYRPTVKEAAKLIGLDAVGQYGLGYGGTVAQNEADKNIYDPTREVTAGANDAGLQQSFFALMHAPTMVKALWDNRTPIAAAQTQVKNARDALTQATVGGDVDAVAKAQANFDAADKAYAEKTGQPTPEPASESTEQPTPESAPPEQDIPDVGFQQNKALALQMAARLSDQDLSKISISLDPKPIQAAVTSVQETARDIGAAEDISPDQKKQAVDSANKYIDRINSYLGSTQYFPLEADKVIENNSTASADGSLNDYYANHHPAVADVTDALDAYEKISSPQVTSAKSGTNRTVPLFLASKLELANRQLATLIDTTVKNAPHPTVADAKQAADIVFNPKPAAESSGPLDNFIDETKKAAENPPLPTVQPMVEKAQEAVASESTPQSSVGEAIGINGNGVGPLTQQALSTPIPMPKVEIKEPEPKDTPEQGVLRERIAKVAPDAPKIVFSTELPHPAWANPDHPGQVFVNPVEAGKMLSKLGANGDEWLRRLVNPKTGEEVIHNAQHVLRDETDHEKIYEGTSPEERKRTITQYGNDSIDPEKATSLEDATVRKVLFVEEHARQILQRKASGETTEDIWKQGDKSALVRYFQALYQKIKAHVTALGATPELNKYLKSIKDVLADAKKEGQKGVDMKEVGISAASMPRSEDDNKFHGAEQRGDSSRKNVEEAARSGSPEAAAYLLRRSAEANRGSDGERQPATGFLARNKLLADSRERAYRELAYAQLAEKLGKLKDNEGISDGAEKIGQGVEHQVFHKSGDQRVTKLTKPNEYGISIVGRDRATPESYMTRLGFQNELFGDDVKWEGINGIGQTITSQPFHERMKDSNGKVVPITYPEIGAVMKRAGFESTGIQGEFYNSKEKVSVADAHPRNFIKNIEGQVHPIDLQLRKEERPIPTEVPKLTEADKPPIITPAAGAIWKSTKTLFSRVGDELRNGKDWSDFRKSTLNYVANLQRNFQNVQAIMKDLEAKIPNPVRRDAITIWREAGGDQTKLQAWANATTDKALKPAYEAALHLTSNEKAVAGKISDAYKVMRAKAITYGMNIAEVQNYATHIWEKDPLTNLPVSGGKTLNTAFQYAKHRSYDSYFAGEQNGLIPKTKSASTLLGAYMNDLNHALAAREYVADLSKGKAKDGRPILAPKTGGWVNLDKGDEGKVHLVFDGQAKEDYDDYKNLNKSAFSNWAWKGKVGDTTILAKSDMAVHPDAAGQLKNIFGTSSLRDWWNSPSETAALGITKRISKFLLDDLNSIAKSNLFGGAPFFHALQEGTEAAGHGVNPFTDIKKPDLNDPIELDKAQHGLMLAPDNRAQALFMEGYSEVNKNLLVQLGKRIPGLGDKVEKIAAAGQDWLFHTYIPALKSKTYDTALIRNTARFADKLKSGSLNLDQVKHLTADQVNNAFGHLNYADIGRNPTIQHMFQLTALAPDFLEARMRHLGQAVTGIGLQSGREQFRAMAAISLGMVAAAQLTNLISTGQTHFDDPFEIQIGNRKYGVRSSPGDAINLFKDAYAMATGTGHGFPYINNRLSPVTRFLEELRTGTNYRGEPVAAGTAIADFLVGNAPMYLQPALRPLTATTRNNPVSPFEQMLGVLGVKISRYSPISQVYPLAQKWVTDHGSAYGIQPHQGVYPQSAYSPIKYALDDGDYAKARNLYNQLVTDHGGKESKVLAGLEHSIREPFTGSAKGDAGFSASLSGNDKKIYQTAKERQILLLQRIRPMLQQTK